jgi:uncharacterized membrane protein YkvA (DUF1232 family)
MKTLKEMMVYDWKFGAGCSIVYIVLYYVLAPNILAAIGFATVFYVLPRLTTHNKRFLADLS